jgi:6-phosphofructokinase 1
MSTEQSAALGVLTSGGDAQGMNAALRAVVRAAIGKQVRVYAIYEGYEGMVEGGERIQSLDWNDVGGIMQRGGTIIGTARSAGFRSRAGRLAAARNLVTRGIDRLVVIGGDGSLTGANEFRHEWRGLLDELLATGQISAAQAAQHATLAIAGLVGSIDNDFCGTDMTIGADTALHRITEAIDALSSTAASHQRTFVVEVMGRNCGYLALMGAVAGGADYVLLPEYPPEGDWEADMCALLRAGRAAGRRDSIVVVAEGARDRAGKPISSEYVKQVLEQRLGEDARVTILGHVQRGGAPSAFDRWMSTLIGYAAVDELLASTPESEPQVIGMRYNRVTRVPLVRGVEETRSVPAAIAAHDYERAMSLRGGSFTEMYDTFQALARALPSVRHPRRTFRVALLNAGGLAPGMNTATRAATRLGLDQGHEILAVQNGFDGLITGELAQFNWGSVDGWGPLGGTELGTSRKIPEGLDLKLVAQTIERNRVDALLVIGGWAGYRSTYALYAARAAYPALAIPIVCLPCSIANNLPGSELAVGADTALNTIVEALDKIKASAVALRRCFVVEVMGRYCGYLALMSALASGAEQVYLHEDGIALRDLLGDIEAMREGFAQRQRLALVIRNEQANQLYSAGFMCALFEEESQGLFDVRQAILGHIQQGGHPSPFDRVQATRLAERCIRFLSEQLRNKGSEGAFVGIMRGKVRLTDLARFPELVDVEHQRPRDQWWMGLRGIARALARQQLDGEYADQGAI